MRRYFFKRPGSRIICLPDNSISHLPDSLFFGWSVLRMVCPPGRYRYYNMQGSSAKYPPGGLLWPFFFR